MSPNQAHPTITADRVYFQRDQARVLRRGERKERQAGYYKRAGMRAVKAFGVFIRLPKPWAALPIRLVDRASHVNEMQSRDRPLTLPICQGPTFWLSLLAPSSSPRGVFSSSSVSHSAASDSYTPVDNHLPFFLPLLSTR